jgi:endoglucanase
MDEIGLMVRDIEEYNGWGFLRVINLGGVDIRQIYGQLVTVHGKKTMQGILGSLPSRLLEPEKRNKPFGYEEIFVDVGLPVDQLKDNVSIGDAVTFRQPLRKLLGQRITGKSLDNRVCVTAVTHALELLQNRAHSWDVVMVATVQEETRLLGGYTTAVSEKPDVAIAIDVTFAKGPGVTDDNTFPMDTGPVLDIGPNVHPGVFAGLQSAANDIEMTVQTGTHTRASGTDAHGLQVGRAGIPTAVVSLPLRYMHTMVESVDINDVKRSGRLLAEFAASLDDTFIDKLTAGMMEL